MKVTSNTLKQLFISFFYLPLLVLAGCSGYKGSLGVQPTENDAPSQAQRSNTQIIVDGAGYIGEFTSGLVAGALGAVPFSVAAGCYSACKGAPIGQGVSDGAASGAYYGYYTGAYVGRHTARIATAALILGGLYAWQGVGWLASNTYNGIKYFTAAGVDGTASDDEDSLVNPNLVSDFPSSSPEGFWRGLVHFLV